MPKSKPLKKPNNSFNAAFTPEAVRENLKAFQELQDALRIRKGEIDSPSEILQRNGDADSPQDFGSEPSEIRQRNADSPQDFGSEPSNRVDRNNGKKPFRDSLKDRNLKHHPLAREPP